MAKLKFKSNGKWESIAAFQGEPGKDGAIQYTAGEGITIENDTISAEVTKQYVDDAIGGIEIPESDSKLAVNFVEISGGRWVTSSETGYDYDWHPIQSHNTAAFDNAIKNTKYNSTIFIKVLLSSMEVLFHSKLPLRTTWTSYKMTGIDAYSGGSMNFYTFTLSVSWDGETPTVTGISDLNKYNITGVKAQNVLVKANTTEYTPTGDYNPATKKYVDDAIANASGSSDEPDFEIINITTPINDLGGSVNSNSYYTDKRAFTLNETDRNAVTAFLNKYWDGYNALTKTLILRSGGRFFPLTFTGYSTASNSRGANFKSQTIVPEDTSKQMYAFTISCHVQGSAGSYTPYFNSSLNYWSTSVIFITNYLNTENTKPYTPAADYNPATKKYVDDAIAALRAELGGE